jgi:hypothetical protein
VDQASQTGNDISLIVCDGLPIAAYVDEVNKRIKVACPSWE